ncbi:MAG: hypothetical protein IPP47_22565 [Bryobacterales bacterium]|nr:hypothetical protein [Bryobacterales bacterium]
MILRSPLFLMAAGLPAALLLPCLCAAQTFALDALKGLQPRDVTMEATTYQGRKAVRATPSAAADAAFSAGKSAAGGGLIVLPDTVFHNGTIELELSGQPRAGGQFADARGFVGVAFRVAPGASPYECFYLRPTNGRADDQLRRNHSAQYISFPDFEWNRLRKETPGKYESYVDLVPGEWTKVKIEVSGNKARLYVHGAAQPVLVVNDLKLGDSQGAVALWIGVGTEAHFTNLRVSQ